MMLRDVHSWDVTPAQAMQVQRMLAPQIIRRGVPHHVKLVAAVDLSVDPDRRTGTAAVAVLRYPELTPVEIIAEAVEMTWPYVPGLLSFREVPALRDALAKVASRPDLLLVDGQGFAHPRRFGIACHLGLLLNLPTIGCAKSRLTGQFDPPAEEAGSHSDLTDDGHVIGRVLRTRTRVSPVYVSVGHRISLDAATQWVLRCCKGHRLPEPARLAHLASRGTLARVLGGNQEAQLKLSLHRASEREG